MNRKYLLVSAVVLMAALLFSGIVFAEGEDPSAPPAADTTSGTETESAMMPVESAADSGPDVVLDETPVDEPPADLEPVLEDAQTAAPEPAEDIEVEAGNAESAVLEEVPAAVDVENAAEPILADTEGIALDMASQESANLISNGDPYWWVGKTKYMVVFNIGDCPAGTAGSTCWADLNPINFALNKIETGLLPTNRKLYIVGGTPFNDNITINSSATYKDLLNGFLGVADGLGNYPVLTGNITLSGMANGFTISDMTITGTFSIKSSKGTVVVKNVKVKSATGSGIVIGDETAGVYTRHVGNVTLSDVTASQNFLHGVEIYTTGAVTINASDFNLNGGDGLRMNTLGGTIKLEDISAIGNQGTNANIQKFQKTLTIKNAVLNSSVTGSGLYAENNNNTNSKASIIMDTVIANLNNTYGLWLNTNGDLNLTNVEANDSVNNSGMYLEHVYGVSPIKVTDSRFSYNGAAGSGNGLRILTNGDVTLTSITAGGNNGDGLYVDNCREFDFRCTGFGYVSLTSPAKGGLSSANFFRGNGGNGIHIKSQGAVTFSNFESNGNNANGILVNKPYGKGAVTLNTTLPYWSNSANSNITSGIYIASKGNINVSSINGSDNGAYGIYVGTNPTLVQISAGDFNRNNTGVYITSFKPVTLEEINANDNTALGMFLEQNDTEKLEIRKINANNNANGILVSTKGYTVFARVVANDNTGYGAQVQGCTTGTCTKTVNFTLYSNIGNSFNNNGTTGLDVRTLGAITLTNVSAMDNGGVGLLLDNAFSNITSGVSISNLTAQQISGNTNGIEVNSYGAITVNQVDSSDNDDYGLYLFSHAAGNVDLRKTSANDNDYGIFVKTNGSTTFTRVFANDNTHYGAKVEGCSGGGCTKPANFTLYSNMGNYFNNNGAVGLDVVTRGAITLTNVSAMGNGGIGLLLDNQFAGLSSAVSITNPLTHGFYGNTTGIDIATNGTITLTSVESSGNSVNGATLDNSSALTLKTLTLNYCNFENNGAAGLDATINGAINVYGIRANNNTTKGAELTNTGGTVLVTYAKRGRSSFIGNGNNGLEVTSTGAVTIYSAVAESNVLSGVVVTADGNVVVSGTHKSLATSFSRNGAHGVNVIGNSMITVNNKVIANGNTLAGIHLDNQLAASGKKIEVNYSQTNGNGTRGLWIEGSSTVVLKNIESQGNTQDGVHVDNNAGVSGMVTVSGVNLIAYNGGDGLVINTPMAATVSGVTANSNGGSGIAISSLGDLTKVSSSSTNSNQNNGIEINAADAVQIVSVKSLGNGTGVTFGDGLWVTTGGGALTIQKSLLAANYGNGIDSQLGGGVLTISNSKNFGNRAVNLNNH